MKQLVKNPINFELQSVDNEVNFDQVHLPFQKLLRYFKGNMIKPICRLYLLNDDETINIDVSEDLIDYDLSITYQSGQRRVLNITLKNPNHKWKPAYISGLVQIGSKFRLDIGFIMHKTAYWKQMGIFLLKDPSMSRESSNQTISFSLCDKFGLFDGTISGKTGLKDIVPVGVPMYQAFVTIVTSDKGNGVPFDTREILFNSKYKHQNTYYTIRQEAGNMLSNILTDLAATISSDVYYNEYGHMCVESNINEFISNNLPVVWHFTEGDNDNINISQSESTGKVVNSVVVKGAIVNGYQFSASAKNTNILSPTCVQYRGELFEYIRDEKLYSDELCRDRAMYELLNFTRDINTINISSPMLPIFDINQAVLIDYPSEGINNELYAINSISIKKNGMSFSLGNMNELVF